MVKIIGLNINNGGTSASLIVDGKLVASLEEERLVRVKNTWAFPKNAINFCLKKANLKLKDIDHFAIPKDCIGRFSDDFEKKLSGLKHLPKSKIRLYSHHLCHAAATYYASGFDESGVLIMDAIGDDECISFFKAGNNQIKLQWNIKNRQMKMHNTTSFSSPADQFSQVTQSIGFGEFGEGKTMAYAVFGRDSLRKVFWADSNFNIHVDEYWKKLDLKRAQIQKDLCFRIQKDLSELVHHILNNVKNRNKNLCLGGGTFLNCAINGEISRRNDVKNLFIQPNARDSGNSLGAALCCHYEYSNRKVDFKNAFSGPEYSNSLIEKEIKKFGLKHNKLDNPSKKASELIFKDQVIGWYQGRCEWGPRALGNRSILARPDSIDIKSRLNCIKGRHSWRPFGISMLGEDFNECFSENPNKYMIISYIVPFKIKDKIRGATHSDGSSRIQTIAKEDSHRYFNLLKSVKNKLGVGCVLNTSFNSKGLPIVCSPKDAIIGFLRMDLDYLIIDDFLVFKRLEKSLVNKFVRSNNYSINWPLVANKNKIFEGLPLCMLEGHEEMCDLPSSLKFKKINQNGFFPNLIHGKKKLKRCIKCKYYFCCLGFSKKIDEKFINPK